MAAGRISWIALIAGATLLASLSIGGAQVFDVTALGAVADGKTKCTEVIRKAVESASAKGGGTIHFPAGVYLTGPIRLRSHITLHIEAGAILKFSDDFDDYLPFVRCRWEGTELQNFSPLIYADGAENIAIRGRGKLDGQGAKWWELNNRIKDELAKNKERKNRTKWEEDFLRVNAATIAAARHETLQRGFMRPPFIQTIACTNLLIEGVTIVNSPFWTINPVYCENVTVHAICIKNPETGPNTDGINPDSCRNVHISDSHISVGDDCVTIKSGRDADGRRVDRATENLTIMNCTMAKGNGGVVIGSEMSGDVRNIAISNCTFDGTDRGIRIKSARGRGGVVENVRVSNIVMRNIVREAVVITQFYKDSEPEPVGERTPIFRDIAISGISGTAQVAGQVIGLSEMPVQNLRFTDIHLKAEKGFSITDAVNVEFDNVIVDADEGPALMAENVIGLELDGFKTLKPSADAPVIELKEVKQVYVRGCTAAPGAGVFVRVDEASVGEVVLQDNNLAKARTPLESARAGKSEGASR